MVEFSAASGSPGTRWIAWMMSSSAWLSSAPSVKLSTMLLVRRAAMT